MTAALLLLNLGFSGCRILFSICNWKCSVSAGGDCVGKEVDPPGMFLVSSLMAMQGASSQVGPMKRMTRKRMLFMQLWIKGWTKEEKKEGKTSYCPSLSFIQLFFFFLKFCFALF